MIITFIKGLISEAEKQVETLTVKEVLTIKNDSNVQLVDLRDIRELWKEGASPKPFTYHGECLNSGLRLIVIITKLYLHPVKNLFSFARLAIALH